MTHCLFDSHCHLDFDTFTPDRAQVITHARQQGVKGFVVPGVTRRQWPQLVQLAQQYRTCSVAFGLHPYFINEHVPADLMHLERMLRDNPKASVGEIGLDAYCPHPAVQLHLLREQLVLAVAEKRPVILHHRKTMHLLLREIKQAQQKGPLLGVLHAFSGSVEQANEWASIGFKLGVGGVITYPRAQKTRQAIAAAPLRSLVLETDSPDMPVAGYQGQRNEPARITEVFAALCALRTESPATIAQQLLINTQQVFPNVAI
ncbi:TatD family deoxyribonuclease [Aliidiomarina taiwanensis]|uniref:TatD family deoxyribonuclease n=1 Tax=Aliidiomarina taiwanensis TaxID=946228 RepID=A0A432X8R4_9GAMM|nr:TatD family hydrolase [Aliidiomarina taiwanensis]RUO43793.1 TatD family deoxyribonuclease [Aliidiomarina taiwanensis]